MVKMEKPDGRYWIYRATIQIAQGLKGIDGEDINAQFNSLISAL